MISTASGPAYGRVLAAVALLLLSSAATAADLQGRVLERGSGLPVADATVTVPDLGRAVSTAADGSFRCRDLAPGAHQVRVEHPGHEAWEGRLDPADSPHRIDLVSEAHELDEVVVTATGYDRLAIDTALPVNVVNQDDLADRVALTMADIFAGEPGLDVSTTGTGSVRPVIRGVFDERVLILVDGMRLSEQRPGGNHILSLDPAQIATIEVVRGPASVLYGSDAIGGVMNVITRKEERRTEPGWRANLTQDVAYESATSGWKSTTHATFGKGRFNGFAWGYWRDTENLETADGELPHSFFEGGTFWAGGGWEGDGWRARLGYSLMRADIGIPASAEIFLEDFFDDETHHHLAGTYVREGGDGLVREFQLDTAWQRHERNRYRLRTPPGPAVQGNLEITIDVDLDTWLLQPRWVLAPAEGHTLTCGLQTFLEDATSARRIVDTDAGSSFSHPFDMVPVIPASDRLGIGAYVQDEWLVSPRWTLVPGLRFDHIATGTDGHADHAVSEPLDRDDQALSGNLGVVRRLRSGWNLYANAGRAFRAPTLLERFFFGPHDAAKDDIGNPDLESGDQPQPRPRPEGARRIAWRATGRASSTTRCRTTSRRWTWTRRWPGGTWTTRASTAPRRLREVWPARRLDAVRLPGVGARARSPTTAGTCRRSRRCGRAAACAGSTRIWRGEGRMRGRRRSCTGPTARREPGPGERATPSWRRVDLRGGWALGRALVAHGWRWRT